LQVTLCTNFNEFAGLPLLRKGGILARCVFGGACNIFAGKLTIEFGGPRQVEALEACLRRKPDAIFAHRLGAMNPILRTNQRLPPVFFDLDDVEHAKYRLRAPEMQLSGLRYHAQIPLIYWAEYRAVRRARRTFVCSDKDRDHLRNLFREKDIVTVPNAVHIADILAVPPLPTLLFLGTYAYDPNRRAAEMLIEQIWPRIHRAEPEAQLILAGPEPERIRHYRNDVPGVIFAGFVDDLPALYKNTRVVCCPVRAGGGTRIKIIEAAAFGKPVVSTSIGAQGLCFQDGRELLVRDDPREFSDACLRLLRDPSYCERIGSAARAAASRAYDHKHTIRLIQQQFTEIAPGPEPSALPQ